MREKWDRRQSGSTYGAITIQKAIDELQSAYGERRGILPAEAFRDPAPKRSAPAGQQLQPTPGDDQSSAPAPLIVPEGAEPSREKPLPWFFYYDSRDNLRVDPAMLKIYFQMHERYFWAANEAMDGVRRYFYNARRGVYELLTEDRIKGRIKNYITKEKPEAVKVRDVNEVYNNLITDECRQPDSTLDSTENLVNFQNGLFDLITWSIYPHQPSVISTVQIPLKFDPSKMYTLDDAPTFRNYLHDLTEGDAQKQQVLLEYMGAALSNIPGYKFKQALFLVGAGDTGKSQYIKLICALLGEINSASVSFSDLAERFQTGAIYGKRIICDADMKVQRAKDNGLFMKITGGDPIQIEYKGMNHFTTIHRGYLLFASNALPKWGGNTTEAAYNRMLIVECDNVIPPERRDPHLLDKLLSEKQAIVYLAFQALVGAVQRGYRFTRPAALDQTLQQLRRNNCPSVDFFTSQCVEYDDAATNKKHWIRKTVLHRIFAEWCRVNAPSAYIPNEREFYRDILQYKRLPDGALKKKVHPGVWYYTFTLTPDAKEEFGVFDSVE
jgi:P4 family phage/plasmid primase-like protien